MSPLVIEVLRERIERLRDQLLELESDQEAADRVRARRADDMAAVDRQAKELEAAVQQLLEETA